MMNHHTFVESFCEPQEEAGSIKKAKQWLKITILPHMIEAAYNHRYSYCFYVDNVEVTSEAVYKVLREKGYSVTCWSVAKEAGEKRNKTAFRVEW